MRDSEVHQAADESQQRGSMLVAPISDGIPSDSRRVVRDSFRRIMTMQASCGSIREYQSDQPSTMSLDRCLMHFEPARTHRETKDTSLRT
jgi:hypothetical protein